MKRIAGTMIALLLAVASGHADDTTGITVQGSGEVRVQPDIGIVTLGVQTQGPDSAKAAAENAAQADRVIAAARGAGVAEKDVQTSGYSISPQYDYRPQQQGKPPILTGYQVNNTVRVTIRKIADVGKVLDAGIKAGANTAGGIAFDLDEPTAAQARDEATKKAVADAIHKAKVIADAAGVTQTKLIAISQGSIAMPRPRFDAGLKMRAMTAESQETPVATGEVTVSAEVSVRYAIGGGT